MLSLTTILLCKNSRLTQDREIRMDFGDAPPTASQVRSPVVMRRGDVFVRDGEPFEEIEGGLRPSAFGEGRLGRFKLVEQSHNGG